MYWLLVLVVIASCEVYGSGAPTSQIIPFEIGGSQVTFDLNGINIDVDTVDLLKCVAHFQDGRDSIEIQPYRSRDGKSTVCRLTPEVKIGAVDIDLINIGVNERLYDPATRPLLSQFVFVDPAPRATLTVAENWDANQVSLAWDVDYFAQFFAVDATFLVQLTVKVANGFNGEFAASRMVQVVGKNTGAATVTLSAANVQRLSDVQFPYYYVLRAVGTASEVYATSVIFAPTLGMEDSLAQSVCSDWLLSAEVPTVDEIHPCPPTLNQIKIDASFMQQEYPWQWLQLADGALNDHVLYQERVATPAEYTQTCSYNSLTGNLATTSPAEAAFINYVSQHVSHVDNYFSDVWPYMVCCLQSNSQEHCDLFHEKRPISTGHDYHGGESPSGGSGDPHMVTFESIKYDFMGHGEFWLIRGPEGSEFGVQGRMSPFIGQQVTYYRAVAIRDRNSTVQIELREGALVVFLNGKELRFVSLPVSITLDKVFLVIDTQRVEARFQNGFTVVVDSLPDNTYINVGASAAHYNKGKGFMGIFGNFDDNPDNDLTTRDGYVIPPTPENIWNLNLLHHRFGLSWLVNATESFFVYEDGKSWNDFTNIEFGPISEYPDPATLPEEVRAACGKSLFCLYEYVGTGSLEGAAEVARQETAFDELRKKITTEVPLCSTLPSPANGRVRVNGYVNGALATYSCNKKYDIGNGDAVRTCSASSELSQWTGAEPSCIWTCTSCRKDTEFELTHNPIDCTTFFLCSYGVRFTLDCPMGEHFGREVGVCSREWSCELGCSDGFDDILIGI